MNILSSIDQSAIWLCTAQQSFTCESFAPRFLLCLPEPACETNKSNIQWIGILSEKWTQTMDSHHSLALTCNFQFWICIPQQRVQHLKYRAHCIFFLGILLPPFTIFYDALRAGFFTVGWEYSAVEYTYYTAKNPAPRGFEPNLTSEPKIKRYKQQRVQALVKFHSKSMMIEICR